MKYKIYKVTEFKIKAPFTLELRFNDNTLRTINFEKILKGEMYSPLNDLELFNKVTIDSEVHTIVWPNGADFDPAMLHDWDEVEDELIKRSAKWDVFSE